MQAELREKLKAIIMVQPGSKIDGAEYALSLMEAAYNLGIQQSDGDIKLIAIEFSNFRNEIQQPYVRNGWQDSTVEELWEEFVKRASELKH